MKRLWNPIELCRIKMYLVNKIFAEFFVMRELLSKFFGPVSAFGDE